MGANVLEFALGLQTSEFLSKLGISADEVLSFAGLAEVVRTAWEYTWEAIGKGAELKGLASATGESVSQLYRLQHGLEAIGSSAENPTMLFMMTQKALSGVNEQGIRTDIILSKLGLNIGKLRSEDTVQSLMDIAGALGKLNTNQATGAGEMLFGRFQTGTVLQMARSMKEFQEGMSAGSNTGALLDKFAATFQQVKADWGDIEGDVLGIWVAIAGRIAPELHKLFSEAHDSIKNIGMAIGEGKFMELLRDSINAAFEQSSFYGTQIFTALATGFGDALLAAVQVVFEDAIPHGFSKLKDEIKAAAIGTALWEQQRQLGFDIAARQNAKTPAEQTAANAAIAQDRALIDQNTAAMTALSDNNDAAFKSKMADAMATVKIGMIESFRDMAGKLGSMGTFIGPATQTLLALIKSTSGPLGPGAGGSGAGGSGAGNSAITPMENNWHHDHTALEKMGFIFNTGGKVNNLEANMLAVLRGIEKNTIPRPPPEPHNPITNPGGIHAQ